MNVCSHAILRPREVTALPLKTLALLAPALSACGSSSARFWPSQAVGEPGAAAAATGHGVQSHRWAGAGTASRAAAAE